MMTTFITLIAALLLSSAPETAERVGDAYPLTICPISERPLGDKPVTIVLENMENESLNGREVKFCCNGCRGRFVENPVESNNKLDELIIKDQLKVYPAMNCMVMPDEELADPRGPEAMEDKNVVIGNRLYRFCCKGCIRKFKKSPKEFIEVLDKSVIEAQKASYPLTVCVITGAPLSASPHEFVVANRLVRTCCGGCAKKVKKNPSAAFAQLGKANGSKK